MWKHFPPRLAGFLRTPLTTRWAVGAVAVILDEEVNPPEVLLVQHSYRTKGAWGLPGGSLESGLRNPREPSKEGSREESRDDIIESSFRREGLEELGIEIDIVRLTKIDAVPYVPEEPEPYRLDFYYRCLLCRGGTDHHALTSDTAVAEGSSRSTTLSSAPRGARTSTSTAWWRSVPRAMPKRMPPTHAADWSSLHSALGASPARSPRG